jgi:mono/diheme cytochrome c family protein
MNKRTVLLTLIFFSLVGAILYSCQASGSIEQDMYYTNGRDLYIKSCQNCHGAHGEGFAALAPPLTDTVYLKAKKQDLVCIIKNGMSGTISINGKAYEGKMPDFQEIADIDLAQIVVYITNSWGNNQGMYTTAQVALDLKNCK